MGHCSQEYCSSCPDRVVCRCLNVTETQIIQAITTHDVHTIRELKRLANAGDGCTCCHAQLQEYLDRISLAVV
jgi:bacterioferritin-associated ferredoxin